MDCIYVCYHLKAFSAASPDVFEKNYQECYKPLLKFLYSNPSFKFSFSFSGTQLLHYKKKHSEFFKLLQELVNRNQCEVFGGGFYNPVMPLLFPADRNGQIDLLSQEIRQLIGKRPHGVTLYADCWDSSLVSNLKTCGIDYVLLEDSMIPPSKLKFLPLFMSELGKCVEIYPHTSKFKNFENVGEYFKSIIHSVEKSAKKDNYFPNKPDRIVNTVFTHDEIKSALQAGYFESLLKESQSFLNVQISTVQDYKKVSSVKVPAYIAAGITKNITKWIDKPFLEIETKEKFPYTVFDFMQSYPQCHALYNRMLYVSMLVNQYHGDKMHKKDAREKMWASQSGDGLLCSPNCTFANARERQLSYKFLMEAEKLIRDDSNFKESFMAFDYNGDGSDEYVCRMKDYFAYISQMSGALRELEVLKNSGNYIDNFNRIEEFDGCTDGYSRGVFVDHIFDDAQFEKYVNGEVAGNGIFSKIRYEEVKLRSSHNLLQLRATAICSSGIKITLLKKYLINSSGLNVQYIIKNESDKKFSAKFVVESNLVDVNFREDGSSFYGIEIAQDSIKKEVTSQKNTLEAFGSQSIENVTAIRVNDTQNGVSFIFEPNEKSSYCFYPLIFKRPNFEKNENIPVSATFVSSMFWNLEIEPGKETERNISLNIFTSRPQKKSQKK